MIAGAISEKLVCQVLDIVAEQVRSSPKFMPAITIARYITHLLSATCPDPRKPFQMPNTFSQLFPILGMLSFSSETQQVVVEQGGTLSIIRKNPKWMGGSRLDHNSLFLTTSTSPTS